jgi:hypothetical protein
MFGPAAMAKTTRTKAIASIDDLAEALKDLEGRLASNGRSLSDVDIDIGSDASDMRLDISSQERVDRIAALGELGVTWIGLRLPHTNVNQTIEALQRFSEEVIAKAR